MMGRERRVHPRAPLNMLVQFRLPDMDAFIREYSANISIGGMFIRTQEPRSEGARLYFQFRVPDDGSVFEGLGKVVHINPPDHPTPGMGIEFINLEENSRRVLDEIIRARAEELDGDED